MIAGVCYPNCGTTTTTFETAQHVVARHITHSASSLAFTGSDIVNGLIIAAICIVIGLLLVWACRAGWKRLG